jgi:hypothetical protein
MSLFRRGLIALVLFSTPGLVVFAQEGTVDLKWKFEKDKTFYQEVTTVTKQTMKVMGMDIVQNQTQTFIFSWTPEKQDEKTKDWIVRQKIEGAKMDIELGGNRIPFDSTKDSGSSGPLADFFKAIIGSEFKVTVSPEMKVTGVEGRDAFLKKLSTANQQMEPLVKAILNDDALKQMADPSFSMIPGKPVKVGETWQRKSELKMGPIGTYENVYKYTYEGKDPKSKNLDRIKVESTLTYQPPTDTATGNLPFKIKNAKLESKEGTGAILFDNAKGRIDSSELSIKLAGSLDIEIGTQTTKVELAQEQKTTLKTSDDNPIKK